MFAILEAGSSIRYNNPIMEVITIKTLSSIVKGFLLSSGFTSACGFVISICPSGEIASTALDFLGTSPIVPNKGFANQNCKEPKSIKIPANPKPQLQPTFSAR
ncbi:hypothetical protein D3C72_890770 [compost metagenome]